MNETMNEWQFTTNVVSWLNELIGVNQNLPFSRAYSEKTVKGTQDRHDLVLMNKFDEIVLTGEIKLPYRKDGGSPHNESLVQSARRKAQKAGAPFFFTWNVNECVLWETFPAKVAYKDRNYRSWNVTMVNKPSHLEVPSTLYAIHSWLATFLYDFARTLLGTEPIGTLSPDEKFIEALESSLKMPILDTRDELLKKYTNKFKTELDKWMREEQGWIIYNDPEGIRENLERAAKFSCYALVNKLVFHEALLERYKGKLRKLTAPEHITSAEELRIHLEGHFEDAKKVTGDYETVFGEEQREIGNRIPFYSDKAVPHWRALIDQIHRFDFSKLDYEVIGSIFERLISPEERHKYGQFYTRPEVVDLINSFCIKEGNESVLDPACGGGTFLVRAYARKRELTPSVKHSDRLNELFGIDISHFAAHLTTINLATRDLIDDENYPQIARSDFFNVVPQHPFLSLPNRLHANGMGKSQVRKIVIPPLDAIVGNPPYVRQEELRKAQDKKNPEPGTKEFYRKLVKMEMHADLTARSDLHCYFWPHAATFLKDEGYLCFLTSSQWLDVEYGFRLQAWILQHFEIVAILESIGEPWFVGARVATTVTILRRQKDQSKRTNNLVRFVQLRRSIREIMANDGSTADAVNAADRLRDDILALTANTVNDRFRARLVRQGDLWEDGVRLSVIMGKSSDSVLEDGETQDGEYFGGKWGLFLRAPDFWFELLDNYGSKFKQLGDIAEVRFGVKSGVDSFFYPIDNSSSCLKKFENASEFEAIYGVPRKLVESGDVKLVLCGEGRGELKPIEAKYLEPEVHSLMEVDGFTVAPEDCSRLILLVGENKDQLKGTFVLDYITWGESHGYHTGSTCAARVTATRAWYDLTGHKRGILFWPKAQQYKHIIPINENNLQCNCNLYDISVSNDVDPVVLAGILNSTLVVLAKFQFGRPVGVEGNLKTEVVDVNMMPIPDPRTASKKVKQRIADAFEKMKERKALYFLSERRLREMSYELKGEKNALKHLSADTELGMSDRRKLDDAVLELIGVKSSRQRSAMIDQLYDYLKEFFEWTRRKEEMAIANKKIAKRRGPIRPSEMAAGIYHEIKDNYGSLLRHYREFFDASKLFDTYEIPDEGEPKRHVSLMKSHGVDFIKGKKWVGGIDTKLPEQDLLIILYVQSGNRGYARVPHEAEECERLLAVYSEFVREREKKIWELIEDVTSDKELQEKVYQALIPLILEAK